MYHYRSPMAHSVDPTYSKNRRIDEKHSNYHYQTTAKTQEKEAEEEDWDKDVAVTQPKRGISSFQSAEKTRIDLTQPTSHHTMPFQQDMAEQLKGRISHDFLIKLSDVSRLIGKGGGNIKEIQNVQNVHIAISKDRDNEWVDVTISGFNQQAIENTFAMIQRSITIRPARSSLPTERSTNLFQSKSSSFTSIASYRNDFNSTQPRLINTNSKVRMTDQSSSGWTRSAHRRCTAAGTEEEEDYAALFGSDEEISDRVCQSNPKIEENRKPNLISSWIPPSTDTFKRVDWNKMRRADLSNDMTKWKDFPPVIKEFYEELPEIASMSDEDVQAIRAEKNNIVVSWFDSSMKDEYEQKNRCQLKIPNPIFDFSHAFHNYPEIMNEIIKQGFNEPSPIQCQAWPVALRGLDFIGIAQTGTGKTLAFLLPALIHIDNQPKVKVPCNGPKALILSPTRELAIQIHQEVLKYSYRGIRSAVIYGGSSRKHQIFQCEEGVEIIIATPGRLNDLIMSNVVDVRSVTYLVLDEADRMLDMGFEPQIMKILLDIRPDRQTIMTSATWPEEVRRIATRYMRNPVQIYIGTLDLRAVHSVQQDILIVKEEEKFDMLLDFIHQMQRDDKVIVFVDRKSTADSISSELIRRHVSCQSIHGDREQSDREQALDDLKTGAVNILVATDVASRGLDIQDITVVFNYDLPKSMEDYVHRIGRTGRAGKTGYSISLVTRDNWSSAGRLIRILEEGGQNIPSELRDMAKRYQSMKDEKREFGGNRSRYADRNENSYRSQRQQNPINAVFSSNRLV